MKKLILLILIGIFTSCNNFFQLSYDKELTEKINLEYLSKKEPIDLIKITDFEWDNYMILSPYSIPEEEGKKYNVDLSNISEYATSEDSKVTLVFIKNKKSIKICTVRAEFTENKLLKVK